MGKAGANYGWSQRAGTFATGYAQGIFDPGNEQLYTTPAADPGYTDPIAEYWHSEGVALGSGFLYRGSALPALYGEYLLADIVEGRIFYFNPAIVMPGTQAVLQSLNLTEAGVPLDLYSAYYPRADARLAELPNHEPLLITKLSGQVFELAAVDVPEPPSLLLPIATGNRLCGAVRSPRGRTPLWRTLRNIQYLRPCTGRDLVRQPRVHDTE